MTNKLTDNSFLLNFTIFISQTTGQMKKRNIKMDRPKGKPKKKSNIAKTRPKSGSIDQKLTMKTKPKTKIKTRPKQRLKPKVKPKHETTPTTASNVVKLDAANEMPDELRWIHEDPHELLLSRFIETPKGTKLGESIGIEKKSLILKNKSNFYSVPLNSIKEKGDKLILRKKIDWKKAAKIGEAWRRRTLDVIKPLTETKSKPLIRSKQKLKTKTKTKSKIRSRPVSKRKKSVVVK